MYEVYSDGWFEHPLAWESRTGGADVDSSCFSGVQVGFVILMLRMSMDFKLLASCRLVVITTFDKDLAVHEMTRRK